MKRRNTPVKAAVLALLEESDTALSQDMIEQQLTISADKVTIYRVLNRFCEDGITHRAISEEGKSYYALCRSCEHEHHTHDHFHFRCLSCDRVECLRETIAVKLPKGYKGVNMNCWISGYCRSCRHAVA
ncbi:Fur family transcriptional regulator [Taibaiella helva]|uniref:Fur family transcriptional regulator n=1 Tax=Taibaiella helva TaxID=2301235 RepID=UPI000E56E6AB|nr:transcriptional repressor [Taibaiella helva]